MNRSVISSIALAGAMLLSTAAFSQTMIDGKEVSAEDLPKVQAACDTLAAKSATDTSPASANTADSQSSTDASSGSTDAGVNAATTTTVDLAALTVEKCQEAGLVKKP